MKWNSLLPAKVACGADLQQLWNDIENSQATHIKQSKIINTSQARAWFFNHWKAKSWIVNCQDLGAWNCKKVAFQNLACQVLNKNYIRLQMAEQRGWHVFMSWKTKSWKNCWHRSNVELIYPQQFQDLESQDLNSELSRLGGMELQKSSISKLGRPSLEQKRCKISDHWTKRLACVHVLEDQVMKELLA